MTDPLGQSQVIPYLKEMSKAGHEFTLISFEKAENAGLRNSIRKELMAENIEWHPLTYHKNPPVLSTITDLWRMYRKAAELVKTHKIDFIHSRSYPPSLVAMKLKKEKGIPFIFDMRGFWADERVEGSIWSLKNPLFHLIYRFFKKKEIEMLKKADAIVSLTENARQWILREWKHNENKVPVNVIPCCCDTGLFLLQTEESKKAARAELQIPEKAFVLAYVGSIGTWYLLDEMMQFYKCLLEIKPNAWFLFITRQEHERIRQKAAHYQINQLKIVSGQRKEVAFWLHAADASVYFIKPTFSKKASSPVKQAEIMATGIPSVSNSGIGDTDLFFYDALPGILVSEFSSYEFKRAAELLVRNQFNPARIRQIALNHFTLHRGVKTYSEIYDRLMVKINDDTSLHE